MDNMRRVGGKPLVCMRAAAAIFVQMGVEKFSEMCVRVRAYTVFKVQRCSSTSAP